MKLTDAPPSMRRKPARSSSSASSSAFTRRGDRSCVLIAGNAEASRPLLQHRGPAGRDMLPGVSSGGVAAKRWSAALLVALACVASPADLCAESGVSLPVLLSKLAVTSARFESMLVKASFTAAGRTDTIDGDGNVSERREGTFRFIAAGARHEVEVLRYTENGEDKTAEARKRVLESEKEPPDPDDALHLPFLASEQPKYKFWLGETDARAPTRVRIHFRARKPARTLFNGSAWVDTESGDVLTMGAAQSKTPLFVDYFSGTLEFGEHTRLGFAVSRATFEGGGGFLFFRKRFRGSVVLSSYSIP
jgi:hypothetical protein